MPNLTTIPADITATQDRINGFWRIRANGKTVGALMQPNYAVALGMLPTADDIRSAVREVNPTLPISADTTVNIIVNR